MPLPRRRFLVCGAAGLAGSLLMAACGRGQRGPRPLIGVLQMVDAQPPNLTRLGFEQALAAAGFREGETVSYLRRDAAGLPANTTLVMQQFLSDAVDLVLAGDRKSVV